ncbi:hypothetical protein GCM10010123_00380 [Pilimelia anulata]|uniref:DUF4870 domain-containing protein n=1 Tax=Pilimelia anulata TaxID=53371 RepID=A0A8J3F709_9ACTN|nr:DUF4870 domain-containing protein [Pilimelia anulata]GGJ74302.1 hypothetical protein GCM10010123_00380 [Pilimelia anulata]
MTEPPRPPGDQPEGNPYDPTAPPPAYPPPGAAPGPPPASPPPGPPGPYADGPPPPPPAGPPAYPAPPGGYQSSGSYPPDGTTYGGGYPSGPSGATDGEDRTWVLVAHFGGAGAAFLTGGGFGWVAPLVAMLGRGAQSPVVRQHAVNALNFQITWAIATVAAYVLAVCSFGILFFVPIITVAVAVILGIIAGVKANEGTLYAYPATIRMIK